MKKKNLLMLPCIAAVAIATFVGKKTFESHAFGSNDLLIANVEALASGGESFNDGVKITCYTSFVYELGASVVDCSTCRVLNDQTDAWYNRHDYCMSKSK